MARMKRRRRSRKQRFKKMGQSTAGAAYTLAKNAYKGFRFIKGLINVERKWIDTFDNTVVPSTGTIYTLNECSAGDDATQRNGTSILVKYLTMRALCTIQGTSATPPIVTAYIRCLIFYDNSGQGTAPTVASVLTSANVQSPRNIDNTDRFWVISDKTYPLNANGKGNYSVNFVKRLGFHCKYYGTSSTNVDKNAIYMLLISDQAINSPRFDWHTRIAFYDN